MNTHHEKAYFALKVFLKSDGRIIAGKDYSVNILDKIHNNYNVTLMGKLTG